MSLEQIDTKSYLYKEALAEAIEINYPQDPPRFLPDARFPAPLLAAASFDEILALREDIQNFHLGLRRPEGSMRFSEEQTNKYVGYIKTALEVAPLAIIPPTIPYLLPEDTKHLILWFRSGVTIPQRANYLANYCIDQKLTSEDIIIVSSLLSRRSVEKIDHSHLLLRKATLE